MKYRYFLLLITGCLFWGCFAAFAQGEEGEVSTELTTPSKDAIFSSKARYRFGVTNTYNLPQEGTISYVVTTEEGDSVKTVLKKVNIPKKSSAKYDFTIDSLKSGFYKISFMINVSYYDDTIRKVFGIRPTELKSDNPKPADFDSFWQKTKAELAKIPPDFKVIPLPDSAKAGWLAYRFEMRSYENMLIKGYLTMPVPKKNQKFAVLLGLPGYQIPVRPLIGSSEDMAIVTLDVRGQGMSRDVINTRHEDYIFYHIEDKEKYVLRGAIMDCIRAVDFIFSRPELDHKRILVTGGSMGALLGIATASLDKRVTICAVQNPILSDVHSLEGKVEWPFKDFMKYIKTQPGLTMQKVLNVLDYYDTKNFATNVKAPVLMGIGLLDYLAPPTSEFAVYNNIKGKKDILIFKDLTHEVGPEYSSFQFKWMRDLLALF